jgi:sugar lactone lactonase YvrE
MLPRLTIGFIVLTAAIAVAACSSSSVGQSINVGPNFPTNAFYATNSDQNGISIYNAGQKGGSPAYEIGGSSTTLDGPQYIAFDKNHNLWVTNYNKQTQKSLMVEIEALATGNVLPLASFALTGRPRGVAIDTSTSTMVVADVLPTSSLPNQLQLFALGSSTDYDAIAGANTKLDVPAGVAFDSSGRVYVTNLQGPSGGSVEKFILPTPTPTPTGSPTASPTPSPTPSPTSSSSASPSPSPSPSPTPTPLNLTPAFVIQGPNTGVVTPTGIAVDANGYVYVSDQGNIALGKKPAILVFLPDKRGNITTAPQRRICGSATLLNAPTDVKVSSTGLIYVADSTKTGSGVLYVYSAAGAVTGSAACTGAQNVAPSITYTSPGAVTGIGLVP